VCSTVLSWEQPFCTSFLTCLQANESCIAAADPLCATKDPNKNPICKDLYNISTASRTILQTYVKCICGL
jgi:hypothetical protein